MTTEIVIVDMTVDDARRLTQRIRLTAQNFIETKSRLISLVEEAKAGNAHLALGYASWTAYLSDVLGDEPLRLARVDRQEMVAILSAEGMSTRAIAPIVGVSNKTVHEDLSTVTSGNSRPDAPERPATVTSLDGRERPATRSAAVINTAMENTGTTNSTAIRDARQQQGGVRRRRRPLPDAYADAVFDLQKVLERLERLHRDDRFPDHRVLLYDRRGGWVGTLAALMASIDDDLGGYSKCQDCGERMLPQRDYETLCEKCRETSSGETP
ncbi:MAG TPA: hypothetical protein VIJ96_01865 [Acidothermaceae bacterium]